MGSTRVFDFIGGFTTATSPTATAPTVSDDLVTKGYGDTTWARRNDMGWKVADTAALQALGTTGDEARSNGQLRLKVDTHDLWEFRSASAATADGTTIIQPTTGSGRWHVVSGGAGNSASGSAANEELYMQKLENERNGFITEDLNNSTGTAALYNPSHKSYLLRMIQNESSGVSTIYTVVNPIVVNDSDKNYDSITSWSAVGDGSTLATSATTPKIGTNKFTFNKGSSAVTAGIRYDRTTQTLAVGANYRVWFWINLPSITNLSNVYLRLYSDSTSNYRTWVCTTTYSGAALAIGWNLIFVDVSSTAGSTATGTGWTYTTASRYQEIGVTASSSAQTYTAIAFGGLWFSQGDIDAVGLIGQRLGLYNNSTRENVIVDSTNTRVDGPITLAAATSNAYNGGISNADAASLQRSSMTASNGSIIFDSTLSSGSIATTQAFRTSATQRESLSQNLRAFIDMSTPQIYKVTSIPGGTSIAVQDDVDTHLNLLSGDTIDIFETVYNSGQKYFIYNSTKTLSSNSTYSSPTLTIPVASSSGIATGYYVAKRHHTPAVSCVAKTANESFQSPTALSAPNGIQLIDSGIYYPNAANVYGHWALGGLSQTDALRQRKPGALGADLAMVGTVNTSNSFLKGRYSSSGFTTSNYLKLGVAGTATQSDGLGELAQVSLWFWYDGSVAAGCLFASYDAPAGNGAGWLLFSNTSATISLQVFNNIGTILTSPVNSVVAGWNHVVVQLQSAVTTAFYINGVRVVAGSPLTVFASGTANQCSYIGAYSDSATLGASMNNPALTQRIADLIIWRDGSILTSDQVRQMYSAGLFQPIGFSPRARYVYDLASQTGQKISLENSVTRTTTAVDPAILKMGVIKV